MALYHFKKKNEQLPLFPPTKLQLCCGSPLSTNLQGLNLRAQPASKISFRKHQLPDVPMVFHVYILWKKASQLRLVVNIPLLTRFYTPQVVIAGFLPSTVIQVDLLRKICSWKFVKLDNLAIDSTSFCYAL